jgi:hypothetical protein
MKRAMRNALQRFACFRFVIAALIAPCLFTTHTTAQSQTADPTYTSESPSIEASKLPERWCRNGAFLDAIKLMNSASRSFESLRKEDAPVATSELGAVLAIAIKQAAEEYHCVRGTLIAGYDRSYAATVKRAMANAQSMRLSPDIVKTANELIATIEASGAPKP